MELCHLHVENIVILFSLVSQNEFDSFTKEKSLPPFWQVLLQAIKLNSARSHKYVKSELELKNTAGPHKYVKSELELKNMAGPQKYVKSELELKNMAGPHKYVKSELELKNMAGPRQKSYIVSRPLRF